MGEGVFDSGWIKVKSRVARPPPAARTGRGPRRRGVRGGGGGGGGGGDGVKWDPGFVGLVGFVPGFGASRKADR